MVLTQLWLIAFLPSSLWDKLELYFQYVRRCVGLQTKWRLPSQSVSDDRCLAISVCGRVHRGHICGFLVFWLQIAIEPFALFHHTGFDYSITSMARTRMARLPWIIRTLFFGTYKILQIAQENKYLGIFFLFLSWNCMLCVLIRIASSRRF